MLPVLLAWGAVSLLTPPGPRRPSASAGSFSWATDPQPVPAPYVGSRARVDGRDDTNRAAAKKPDEVPKRTTPSSGSFSWATDAQPVPTPFVGARASAKRSTERRESESDSDSSEAVSETWQYTDMGPFSWATDAQPVPAPFVGSRMRSDAVVEPPDRAIDSLDSATDLEAADSATAEFEHTPDPGKPEPAMEPSKPKPSKLAVDTGTFSWATDAQPVPAPFVSTRMRAAGAVERPRRDAGRRPEQSQPPPTRAAATDPFPWASSASPVPAPYVATRMRAAGAAERPVRVAGRLPEQSQPPPTPVADTDPFPWASSASPVPAPYVATRMRAAGAAERPVRVAGRLPEQSQPPPTPVADTDPFPWASSASPVPAPYVATRMRAAGAAEGSGAAADSERPTRAAKRQLDQSSLQGADVGTFSWATSAQPVPAPYVATRMRAAGTAVPAERAVGRRAAQSQQPPTRAVSTDPFPWATGVLPVPAPYVATRIRAAGAAEAAGTAEQPASAAPASTESLAPTSSAASAATRLEAEAARAAAAATAAKEAATAARLEAETARAAAEAAREKAGRAQVRLKTLPDVTGPE